MRIARLSFVAAAFAAIGLVTTSAFADHFVKPPVNLTAVDQAVNLIYDPGDGSMHLVAEGLEGLTTTTLESLGAHFDPSKHSIPIAPFPDQNTISKFFKLTAPPAVATRFDFDAGYYALGFDFDQFDEDMRWSGSIAPAGSWSDAPGGGPYLHVVPEPASLALIGIGMLGLLSMRRK